jgi:peptidoglycan hydrolase-like protein with peptidoglycan-binding domain
MQSIRHALCARVSPVAMLLGAAVALSAVFAGPAAASPAYTAASAHPRPLPETGWHGRPIRQPRAAVDERTLAGTSYPVAWQAGAVGYGAGYHSPNGSLRVREVQWRLKRRGYHTGPIDGLYGPLTRSAVQWFQIKHGLRPTGVVAATTLAALRNPNALTTHSETQVALHNTPTPRPEPLRLHRTASHEMPSWLVPALATLFAATLALALLAVTRTQRTALLRRRLRPARAPATASATAYPAPLLPTARRAPPPPVEAPIVRDTRIVGYLTSDNLRTAVPHEVAIREMCKRRGWKVTHLARDSRTTGGRTLGRPGLSNALHLLAEGNAERLVVHELRHLAHSASELRVVLSWFLHMGVPLTALDVELDTGTEEGTKAARAILSVTDAEPFRGRTREGLPTSEAKVGGSVADRPELAERIRSMRASGMTLQAIADTLNEDGVPTVRGGARWRPSSVQSVLGYKRTRTRARA